MPDEVQGDLGHALWVVQEGETPRNATPLHGYGSGVMEITDDFETDTYRAVYTVRFRDAVYVLAVFQKKAKRGIETPKHVLDLIHDRLRWAEQHYAGRILGEEE